MKPGILFIDDDTDLLAGLRRALRKRRSQWDMHFCNSPWQALEQWERLTPDAVVTDMRMPQVNGLDVLTRVAQRSPSTIRIILTGHADRDLAIRTIGIAHQQVSKPCDTDILAAAIERSLDLRDRLADPELQSLVSSTAELPSMPDSYRRLRALLQDETTPLDAIGELIAADPPMTARLLKLVNSAFLGGGRSVASPREAVAMIGLEMLQGLFLAAGLYEQFTANRSSTQTRALEQSWQRSLAVAALARRIGTAEGLRGEDLDSCATAGLLHDVGQLVLNFTPKAAHPISESTPPPTRRPADHGALGAYLLGLWALPTSIVEAVAHQDRPMQAPHPRFGALTAVHAAKTLYVGRATTDIAYLESLGMADRLSAWKKLTEVSPDSIGSPDR